jgi:hypothetical protein
MANTRFALVLLAVPLLVACNTRYHLAGEVDSGVSAGTSGLGIAGAAGGLAGAGGTTATGLGGAAGSAPLGGTTGASTEPVPLQISPRDAVTRVARVLWESPPDQALVEMADSGSLATDADVRRLALRMLADPRARVGVAHFYHWWLNLDALATTTKDPILFPEYSAALGTTMAAETEAFALDVTLDGDGDFRTLMRGSYSFLNDALANLYGIAGVTGSDLRKVDLDPTQRAGILTQPAFLAQTSSVNTWTSPTHRGSFVSERILCRPIPAPPPPNPPQMLVDPAPPETNRQRLARSVSSPVCVACHNLMDPLGLAYEGFDSIGRVRLTDSGLPIDASGHVSLADGDHAWKNAIELSQFLANAPDAQQCLGQQWLRYILGHQLTDADVTSVSTIASLFAASSLDLHTVIAAAVSSASFLAPTGGPPCGAGISQSCNDDIRISSIHGTCTAAGKCVCTGTFALNPTTGRCL